MSFGVCAGGNWCGWLKARTKFGGLDLAGTALFYFWRVAWGVCAGRGVLVGDFRSLNWWVKCLYGPAFA